MSELRVLTVGVACASIFGGAFTFGQAPSPKDISFVYNQGKIAGQEYRNDYFGLTLAPREARFTDGAFLNLQGKRARLVDAQADAQNWDDKYEIAILADLLEANPRIHSPEQYVRAVRHALEKEGLVTVNEEATTEVSGTSFVWAMTKGNDHGRAYYRGLYTTFLNGYIFSLDVTATSPERLTKIVQSTVHLKSQGK